MVGLQPSWGYPSKETWAPLRPSSTVYVAQSTSTYGDFLEEAEGLTPDLDYVSAYVSKIGDEKLLSFNIDWPLKLRFLTDVDFESYAGWEEYYRKFPDANGYLVFSRVGFSRDGRTALFSTSSHHGSLHTQGHFVVMRFSNDAWKIWRRIDTWIS